MAITIHSGQNSAFLTNQPINKQKTNSNSCNCATNKKPRQTIKFNNPVSIIGRSTLTGQKEGKGPIGKYFHQVAQDDKLGEKSFERAELKMLQSVVLDAIKDANLKISDIDLFIAGDLLNQITGSSYLARELRLPYLGVYSACSTMSQSLLMGASLIDMGHFNNVACATSSHFATAERQYRYPLEYGCQRPPYAQWTVTGSACTILSNETKNNSPKITSALIGKVTDFGINDLNNMGAAMAPAGYII